MCFLLSTGHQSEVIRPSALVSQQRICGLLRPSSMLEQDLANCDLGAKHGPHSFSYGR